jgi:hypothetical protein
LAPLAELVFVFSSRGLENVVKKDEQREKEKEERENGKEDT